MIFAFKSLEFRDRSQCLVSLAIQDQQMGKRAQYFLVVRRQLSGNQQIGGASLKLAMATVEITEQMEKLYGFMRSLQVSAPSRILPSSSR